MNKPTIKPVSFPWNDEDLRALEACITTRWEVYAENSTHDLELQGVEVPECHLCMLGIQRAEDSGEGIVNNMLPNPCPYCVIQKDTGCHNCSGTPYPAWSYAIDYSEETRERQLKLARKELEYLEDLRERMLASVYPTLNATMTASQKEKP